jgi:hypothetical protein
MKTNKRFMILMISLWTTCTITIGQTISGKSNAVAVDFSKQTVSTGLGVANVPTYHALIIAVSQYQNAGPGLPNLDQPVKDGEQLREVLENNYLFAPGHVTLLKNPTREEIINKFDLMATEVTDRDNVLIFYAGHGYFDKNTEFGFWLPSDAKTSSRAHWIANSTIKDYVSAIRSKHTLLITDACFSGSIFKTRSVDAMTIRRVHELYKDRSRKAMTSGNLTEVADKSFFIQYLLKLLKENDQEFLPASILFSRLYEPVTNNSSSTPQFGVIQGAGDEGGDFIFIKKGE